MKQDIGVSVSKNSIYRWLRSSRGQPYCTYLYSKRCYVKKRIPKTSRVMIPNCVGIQGRPLGAANRSRYGHFEVDTIVSGKRGTGAISVVVERKSRCFDLRKLNTLKPSEYVVALKSMFKDKKARSVTFDNGIENKHHESLDIPTFFCDPYSSWQKGSVENINKMIRRYIPKGTNLKNVTQEELNALRDTINNKPRAVLGFKSAYDVV